jgi:hypothetical protein
MPSSLPGSAASKLRASGHGKLTKKVAHNDSETRRQTVPTGVPASTLATSPAPTPSSYEAPRVSRVITNADLDVLFAKLNIDETQPPTNLNIEEAQPPAAMPHSNTSDKR